MKKSIFLLGKNTEESIFFYSGIIIIPLLFVIAASLKRASVTQKVFLKNEYCFLGNFEYFSNKKSLENIQYMP